MIPCIEIEDVVVPLSSILSFAYDVDIDGDNGEFEDGEAVAIPIDNSILLITLLNGAQFSLHANNAHAIHDLLSKHFTKVS